MLPPGPAPATPPTPPPASVCGGAFASCVVNVPLETSQRQVSSVLQVEHGHLRLRDFVKGGSQAEPTTSGLREGPASGQGVGGDVSVSKAAGPKYHIHSVVSDSLRPHRLQHTRPPCPPPSPRVPSNSCPLSQ